MHNHESEGEIGCCKIPTTNITLSQKIPEPVVGNKAKGRISGRVFQENKARQIFRKTDISNPLNIFRGIEM